MKTDILKSLVFTQGVSGGEMKISDKIREYIEPLTDECYNDAMGSLIAVKHGTGKADHKKIMLCAHMDEIGFVVTYIEENGLIRFATIGGINFLSASFTNVISASGVHGVLVPEAGTKPESVAFDKCYIDVGASSRREAEKKIKIGDYFAVEPSLTHLMSSRYAGRPLDDRIGCFVLIMIAEALADKKLDDDIYYAFTVQEEVGCRGSKPASFAISPDLALIYDVTGTGDVPGAKPMAVKVGGGAAIKVKDSSVICHAATVGELIATAKGNKIKYQCEILTYGGTDTSSVQMSGVGCRAAAISIPTRYIHSNVEMIDTGDVDATVALTVAYLTK